MVATEAPFIYEEDDSPQECRTSLEEAGVEVTLHECGRWSKEQRRKAIEWVDFRVMAYPFAPMPPPPTFLSSLRGRSLRPP